MLPVLSSQNVNFTLRTNISIDDHSCYQFSVYVGMGNQRSAASELWKCIDFGWHLQKNYILWYTFPMFDITVAISKYRTIFSMIVCDATCVMPVYRLYFVCVSARYNDTPTFDNLKTIVTIKYVSCKDRHIAIQQYLMRFVVISWWILRMQKLILVMKSFTYIL